MEKKKGKLRGGKENKGKGSTGHNKPEKREW